MSSHDSHMPTGWHTIKSVLLVEMATAANFHQCCKVADALFHARLLGESCAKKMTDDFSENPRPEKEKP